MEAGFVEEVRRLRARGDLHADLPAIRAVGYRQIWEHLEGRYDLEEARNRILAATRQLAKRQLTWLRKWPDLHWLYTDAAGNLLAAPGSDYGPGPADIGPVGQKPLKAVLNYLDSAPV